MSTDYFDNNAVRILLDKHLEKNNKELYDKLHSSKTYRNKGRRKKHLDLVKYLFKSKKNRKAQNKSRKMMLLNLGLVISLGLILLAFEWRSYNRPDIVELAETASSSDEILDVPVTEQPPPPPPEKNILKHANIVEVPDMEEIKQDLILDLDIEVSEETTIETVVFPEIEESVEEKEEKVDEIFILVEEQPQPEGGFEAFYEHVGESINYPVQAKRMGVSGKVFVQFVVEKNGRITKAEVVKGIGGGCDREAVRVVLDCPIVWTPGKQRGKPVRTRMIIPIHFALKKR